MCCIDLGRKTLTKIQEKPYNSNGVPQIIEGVDIINTLCPVSKKSGMRENFLSLIRKLVNDPAKQALLYQCIQELPVDNSQANLDENSKFEFCPQRLQTGTPAENAVMLDVWQSVVDLYVDSHKAVVAQKAVDGSSINFDGSDKAAAAAESE